MTKCKRHDYIGDGGGITHPYCRNCGTPNPKWYVGQCTATLPNGGVCSEYSRNDVHVPHPDLHEFVPINRPAVKKRSKKK